MQLKLTLRFHLTVVRMVKIKKGTNTGKDMGKEEPYYNRPRDLSTTNAILEAPRHHSDLRA